MLEWKELEDVFRPSDLSGEAILELLGRSADRVIVLTDIEVLNYILSQAKDQQHEVGGILLGAVYLIRNSSLHLTHVKRPIVAKGADGSPVHLRFTSESWQVMRTEIADSSNTIVGWFHTHPGLGVFMSGTDRRTQRCFFSQPWQVSLVVDPKSEGYSFFVGENSVPVREIMIRETN